MKSTALNLCIFAFFLFVKAGRAQTWAWANSGNGNCTVNEGYSVCSDTSGNVFLAGSLSGLNVVLGTYTLTGGPGICLIKYDSNGNLIWAKSAQGGNATAYSVTSDLSGNTYLTGYFWASQIVFGTYTLTNTSANNLDIFLVKYDPNGNVLWAKSAGGAKFDFGNSVSTDAAGNVYLAGKYQSNSFTIGTITFTTSAASNMFISKYDTNGNFLWAKSSPDSTIGTANSVSADAAGNAFVTGYFNGPKMTLGTYTLVNTTGSSVFLAKYDLNGNVVWAKNSSGGLSGGCCSDKANSVRADASGNIYIAGQFFNSYMALGTTTLTAAGGIYSCFLYKFDPLGNVVWGKKLLIQERLALRDIVSLPMRTRFM